MKKFNLILLTIGLLISLQTFAQDTYKIGNTEYYYNQKYSTTGKPMVKRSSGNKTKFLNSLGYSSTPYGYEIDHIKPLSEGGTDDSSNMQLLTKQQHARKTARERGNRSNFTYNRTYPTYKSNSTYSSKSYNFTPSSSSSGKTIYIGKNGGKYYINSNGKKSYVKSKKKTRMSNYNYSSPTYNSSSSRTIQTGSRGGKYYINSNGNKTYVKKKN